MVFKSHLLMVLRCLAILAISMAVHAADVEVRVTATTQNIPVSGASVCLETPAYVSQFRAQRTNAEGSVVFSNIPDTPLRLTVSKTRFRGKHTFLSAESSNRVVLVRLQLGSGGPVCAAPEVKGLETAGAGLQVESCRINHGAATTTRRQVTLECVVHGDATHYRISENQNLTDASWRPYESTPRIQLGASRGEKTVYFQVRRYSETSGARLQMVSNVVHDSIRLTGP